MFIPAVEYLREKKGIEHISVYGQSMGSIFAVLVAQYIGGMENLIMVSPTHVPFEGTAKDKKTMTGRSVATFKNEDIPFVSADFSKINATKYYKHPGAEYKVIVYPHGSHLNGLMPSRDREKKLYWMIPIIGLMYKTFGKYRKDNLRYFEESEKEIIDWIMH